MIKKILLISFLVILVFQNTAFAFETDGDIVFRDALYGAAIGAVLGSAIYLADDREDFAAKFGVGVAVGTLGGLAFGVVETRGLAEIENNEVRLAVPVPGVKKKGEELQYSATLLKAKF